LADAAELRWQNPAECQTTGDHGERCSNNSLHLTDKVYDFAELEHIVRGLLPKSVDDEIVIVDHASHDDGQWDVDMLMSSNGVS